MESRRDETRQKPPKNRRMDWTREAIYRMGGLAGLGVHFKYFFLLPKCFFLILAKCLQLSLVLFLASKSQVLKFHYDRLKLKFERDRDFKLFVKKTYFYHFVKISICFENHFLFQDTYSILAEHFGWDSYTPIFKEYYILPSIETDEEKFLILGKFFV